MPPMPSSRRLKVAAFFVVLSVLIILYITTGARNTYESPFYTRTVEALQVQRDAESRANVIAKEQARLARVERLRVEHDSAVASASSIEVKHGAGVGNGAAGAGTGPVKQKPLAGDVKEAGSDAKDAVTGEKSVAGRKKMKDDKVVQTRPATDADDGVAKVGNVDPKASGAVSSEGVETEEDRKVETELNDILKKGPIIIFSKSYCPFSKKAKHILLELYSITPKPFVVELDLHELGSRLQSALNNMTGRRTVPNILINGKSIGGGDDVERLHQDGKLIDHVSAMGGKRIMEIKAVVPPASVG